MRISVITNEYLQTELLAQGLKEGIAVEWSDHIPGKNDIDCCIDLLFDASAERINLLVKCGTPLIIVNAVDVTAASLPENFIRINGWPGFLGRNITEASGGNTVLQEKAGNVLALFGKQVEWVPDVPGFITARVISMIINEAYFALDEKVSTMQEIDIAMKLGTNYPYGPFEWADRIGLKNIYSLLLALSKNNNRYTPAERLQQEALTK